MTSLSRTRRWAPILVLAAALVGCKSVQSDLAVERLPEHAFAALDGYESELVLLEAEPSPDALARLRGRMSAAASQPVLERTFASRLAALTGRAALLAGDRASAEKDLKKALSLNPGDELARVLEARLERNAAKRLELLEAALAASDGQKRLQAEKGRLLASSGRYAEALAAFDASLPFLPEAYERAFGAERRRALALRDASGSAKGGGSLLSDRKLTLESMAALAQEESPLVDFLTGGKTWASGVLFERLRGGGYFPDPSAPGSAVVRRGDAAFFLWRLVANRKNDRTLLVRYSARYGSRPDPVSPVPDVPLVSPWFDAVLGCVEREIMELPDGRRFFPEDPVTGLEFYRWIRKASEL